MRQPTKEAEDQRFAREVTEHEIAPPSKFAEQVRPRQIGQSDSPHRQRLSPTLSHVNRRKQPGQVSTNHVLCC